MNLATKVAPFLNELDIYGVVAAWHGALLEQVEQANMLVEAYGSTSEASKKVQELYQQINDDRSWFDKNVMNVIKTSFSDGTGRKIDRLRFK